MTGQSILTEDRLIQLFRQNGLGTVIPPIVPVSGGLLHRMYRVHTEHGSYAVKQLNPEIMRRPAAMENFRRAEALEVVLEEAGIPVVAAITVDGRKMQELDGAYFYIFPWQNGTTTDCGQITTEQCRITGNILGRMHAISSRQIAKTEPASSAVDWSGYILQAHAQNSEIAPLLQEHEALLEEAQAEMNRARAALPGIECITDEDMDPKNVMWDGGQPAVIDLECLEIGKPVSGVLQLSLQWAGVTICELDFGKFKAFFDGYLAAYDNGFRAYDRVFGLAYTWIEWLEYNIQRSLGQCQDEAERAMGIAQVKLTLAGIRYLRDMEAQIKQHLQTWFSSTGSVR